MPASTTGKQVRAAEWESIHLPPIAPRKRRRLVVFCHGRSNTALDFVNSGMGDVDLNAYGVPVVYHDNGGAFSWGNESAIASIDECWAFMQAKFGVPSDKLLLYFGSMGNFPAWNWIRRNPGKVAAVVCGLPVVQYGYLHDTVGAPYAAEIDAAHGAYATAQALDPSTHTAEIVAGLQGAPVQFWYPTNDPLQPLAQSLAFADALAIPSSQRFNMGAIGHSMSGVDRPTVARFLARYSV